MSLDAKDIHLSFSPTQPVLSGISVGVSRGERIALIGPSGSGKTTLLRILAGLVKPDTGTVQVDDIEYRWDDDTEGEAIMVSSQVWPIVTLVFQDLRLFPGLTAAENCMLGLPMATDKSELTIMAKALGVVQCLDRRPFALSRGEAQRFAIIRALLRRPTYLLLDEPTAALDAASRTKLVRLLLDINAEFGMSILTVTHDPNLVADLMSFTWTLRDGTLT